MFILLGAKQKRCDGLTRRGFLTIGAFGAGLSLADMLRAQTGTADAGSPNRAHKAAIMIYLPGGPSQAPTARRGKTEAGGQCPGRLIFWALQLDFGRPRFLRCLVRYSLASVQPPFPLPRRPASLPLRRIMPYSRRCPTTT
jgi:hypothetical protein